MAETAITTVLAKVAELVAWEAAVLLEVGDDVRLLRDKLEWLHTFICDDEFVAVWVRQTRDVAFEAEDALDDFLHRAGRRRAPLHPPAAGCWWPGCAGQVSLRHDLYGRICRIKKRLDEISANRAAFNIEPPAPAWAASSSSSTTLAAWDDLEEYTVGLDKYSDMLKEQLLDESVTARALVSISGKSSIGKTTLARKVYQSPEVRNHFEIRTWTVLPHKSRPAVLRDIHRLASSQLPRSPSQQCVEDGSDAKACGRGKDISNQLYRNLTGRRYLVVVDGSIAVTDWNSLRASLPDEGNGSRVVLIMDPAGLEVVGHAGSMYDPIELTRLSPENTYEVFRRRVFGRGDCPGRYKSRYYQDVFRITRGLPLSVVVLAGVLRSKELPAEWDEVMAQLAPARGSSPRAGGSCRWRSTTCRTTSRRASCTWRRCGRARRWARSDCGSPRGSCGRGAGAPWRRSVRGTSRGSSPGAWCSWCTRTSSAPCRRWWCTTGCTPSRRTRRRRPASSRATTARTCSRRAPCAASPSSTPRTTSTFNSATRSPSCAPSSATLWRIAASTATASSAATLASSTRPSFSGSSTSKDSS